MKLLAGQETTVNYIKKLQAENEALKNQQAAVLAQIITMRAHLASSKFTGVDADGSRKDWISTGDISRFLSDLTSQLVEVVDIEEISAQQVAEKLTFNGNAYHSGDIDYADMASRNAALWQQAEQAGIDGMVKNILNAAR